MELYNGKFKLYQLARKRPSLIDTCSLISGKYDNSCVDEIERVRVGERSADYFMGIMRKYPRQLLVTSSVLRQYMGGLEFGIDKRRKLESFFIGSGGIVGLGDEEFEDYNMLFKIYRADSPALHLDGVDFDFALTAIVLSRNRGPMFAITNDGPLASFLVRACNHLGIKRENLCCLTRYHHDVFWDPFKLPEN